MLKNTQNNKLGRKEMGDRSSVFALLVTTIPPFSGKPFAADKTSPPTPSLSITSWRTRRLLFCVVSLIYSADGRETTFD